MVMKDYLGRDLLHQPSEDELEKRRKSTMSKKYEEYIYEQNFILVVGKQSIVLKMDMVLV